MILSFKKQFQQPILEGTKIHTIREDKPNRWKSGNKIHFATGVRTPNYKCFKEGKCASIQNIKIKHCLGYSEIRIDGTICFQIFHHGLGDIYEWSTDFEKFVKNDGFNNIEDFFKWFNTDFEGKIIHWTKFNY